MEYELFQIPQHCLKAANKIGKEDVTGNLKLFQCDFIFLLLHSDNLTFSWRQWTISCRISGVWTETTHLERSNQSKKLQHNFECSFRGWKIWANFDFNCRWLGPLLLSALPSPERRPLGAFYIYIYLDTLYTDLNASKTWLWVVAFWPSKSRNCVDYFGIAGLSMDLCLLI